MGIMWHTIEEEIMNLPHRDKLVALFNNPKLSESDLKRKDEVFSRYENWMADLKDEKSTADQYLAKLVDATNKYKNYIDLEFIFSSDSDFLYRQKGQLKLDNTILEECLPFLVDKRLVSGAFAKSNYFVGDVGCYAGLSFGTWLSEEPEDRIFIKQKNQDFAVGKSVEIKITDGDYIDSREVNIAYFAAELKTNLDKTMFQEASATARELKANVQNSKYYLVCEWLDMTPIDSSTTSIDAVIVLRKQKRMSSNKRSSYSSVKGRKENYVEYKKFIEENPLDIDMFKFLVQVLNTAIPIPNHDSKEEKLERGYF